MLNAFYRPQLEKHQINIENVDLQRDGAPAHSAEVSIEVVRNMFPGRIINRFGDIT